MLHISIYPKNILTTRNKLKEVMQSKQIKKRFLLKMQWTCILVPATYENIAEWSASRLLHRRCSRCGEGETGKIKSCQGCWQLFCGFVPNKFQILYVSVTCRYTCVYTCTCINYFYMYQQFLCSSNLGVYMYMFKIPLHIPVMCTFIIKGEN